MCQIHLCQLSVKTRMSVIGFSYQNAKFWLHRAEGFHLSAINRRQIGGAEVIQKKEKEYVTVNSEADRSLSFTLALGHDLS